jgi:phage terminase large subunit GpA-like protein
LIAFHATGDYMVFKSSTPTIKGRSRIDQAFEKGDQRYWNVTCPQCGLEQKLEFGGEDTAHGLKFNRQPPYNAHYVCRSGCVIEHHQKAALVQAGRFVAENEAGLYPSFHLDALTSRLTTWDKIAEAFLEAKDNPTKLKAFVNLWLGQSWEERGEAPEWKLLLQRREAYPKGVLPVGALLITLTVDVQGNGLFYEVIGWGADKQSWSIDAGFLPGDTADPDGLVWRMLSELYERRYPDAYGNAWQADATGVDAGFNTEAVKAWVRGRPRAFALKGQPGWYLPPLGTPAKVDVTFGGKKRSRGALIWPVGTWPLKAEFYALLRKDPPYDGAEAYPSGFVHLAEHNDERYCRQLVAETLKDRESRGRVVKEWVAMGDNHFHDCRIYGMALFDHLGGNRFTADNWRALAVHRGVKPERQIDLFSVAATLPAPKPAASSQPATGAAAKSAGRRVRSSGIS